MAITRSNQVSSGPRGLAAALALGGAGCTTYPSPPAEPAFDTDVLPIFQAHCTRCHDNNLDGGANSAVDRAGRHRGPRSTAGLTLHLTQFGSRNPDGGAPTICANVRPIASDSHEHRNYIHRTRQPAHAAPAVAAAQRLGDEGPRRLARREPIPICSNSANPDPALLCP